MIQHQLTIGEARLAARRVLKSRTETAWLDADLILSAATSLERSHLGLMSEIQLDIKQRGVFESLIARRLAGEPVAYLTQCKEFWSLPLFVNHATLVPRPETELVVDRVLVHASNFNSPVIADLGTGSGAIALAVASELESAVVFATDQCPNALQVAKKNQRRLAFENVEFFCGNWTSALPAVKLNVVAANPPYIQEDDPCLKEPSMRFEPNIALTAGADGLADIRKIIESSCEYLLPGGWLVIEHGYDQAAEVRSLMKENGYLNFRTFRDLAGLDRVTEAQMEPLST